MHCEKCRWTELTMWQRIVETLTTSNTQRTLRAIGEAQRGALRVALGGVQSDYERHRQAWIETGDYMELQRMLRHV